MTNLPAASMATLVALVNTFVTGAIAGTAYLSLGGNPSAALVWAAAGFAIASVLIWGWVFRQLHRVRRSLVVRYPRDD
jgi:quinol-cytochrome oxidoreductase complex cytochrome b subunit